MPALPSAGALHARRGQPAGPHPPHPGGVRGRQQTADFRARYALRAGIEGTLSQAVRAFDLRRARYVGLAKTRLQHILIATALTLVRLCAWFGEAQRAATRTTPFASLFLLI